MNAANATCRPTDHANAHPHGPCSKKISAFAAILLQRLGHNADVCDARLLHRVHHASEGAQSAILVTAYTNKFPPRLATLLPSFDGNFSVIDGVTASKI